MSGEMMPDLPDELWDVQAVAEHVGVRPVTVRLAFRTGRLRGLRVRGRGAWITTPGLVAQWRASLRRRPRNGVQHED